MEAWSVWKRAGSSGPAWVSVLLFVPAGDGVTYRLNELHPMSPGGDVMSVAASADGEWIVYRADGGLVDNVQNLYSVPTDGSAPPQAISDNGDYFQAIADVTITPDGARVLYLQRPSGAPKSTLYGVPIDGSAPPVDLSGGQHVTSYQVTSDSARAVFIGDIFTAERFLLCSIPIDGVSGPVVLNAPLPAGEDVTGFELSPDGTRAVYWGYGFFSAPVDVAGGAIELSTSNLYDSAIAADGTRLVYRRLRAGGTYQLYSRVLDGSSPEVRLHGDLDASRSVEDYHLGADASRVLFRADLSSDDVVELWSVPIDASAPPLRLSPLPPAGGDVRAGLETSADGALVVFRGDLATNNINELWSAPVDGSAPAVKLNGPLAGEEVLAGFALSPNGTGVAFLTGAGATSTLRSVPIDGSAAPLVLDSESSAGSLSALAVGAAGSRVVYEKPDATERDLWSVPFDGSAAAIQLSAGELVDYELIPGGVLFITDEQRRTVFELFARPLSGNMPSFQINAEFPNNVVAGSVTHFLSTNERALYVADTDIDDVPGLFSVPLSRERAPIRISAWSGPPIHVSTGQYVPLTLDAAGGRAIFRGRTGTSEEVYSVPIDGTSDPVVLNSPLHPAGNVTAFKPSSDGSRVVYLADQPVEERYELYRAESDGSGSPVKLNATPVASGDVHNGFVINADGSLVVYVADQDTDEQMELYAADGVNPPVKLSGTLPAFANVELDPQISPDGAWVFYRADPATNGGPPELFRVPIDGSSSPVQLSAPIILVLDGFRITPDGTRVVFRADAAGPPSYALYSTLTDGSASPVQLNSASGSSGSQVSEVVLDPSGTLAVFRYDAVRDDYRLYSVAVDGSAPQVLLTPLPAGQEVLDTFQISPDGSRVLYQASEDDLYAVPIDGSAPPTHLAYATTALGGREPVIDPTEQRVAFVDAFPNYRLYTVPIDGARPPREIGPPPDGSDRGVAQLGFTPDGAALLYRLRVEQGRDSYDLWVAGPGKGPRRSGPPEPRIR